MREINRVIVAALIIRKDNHILFARKDPKHGGVYPDCWQIPGGGIEDGESALTALAREVHEEVGLNIGSATIELLDDSDGASTTKRLPSGEEVLCHMKFIVYRVDYSTSTEEPTVTLGSEFVEFRWVAPADIASLKLVPAGDRLFEKRWATIFRET
jgi:8-oxo-dGTP pyrophosphatase MutT (NUDIX family)